MQQMIRPSSVPKRPRSSPADGFCFIKAVVALPKLAFVNLLAFPSTRGSLGLVYLQNRAISAQNRVLVCTYQRTIVSCSLSSDGHQPPLRKAPTVSAFMFTSAQPPLLPPADISEVESHMPSPDCTETIEVTKETNRRKLSAAVRHKISISMLGHRKSEEMRAKVSEKLKGRVPWNKGKKLSPEIRARMSAAHTGRSAWNKGKHLSLDHRANISNAGRNGSRKLSEETRHRMQMSRRRMQDGLSSTSTNHSSPHVGSYSLLDGADINAYISLRRELTSWSDSYRKNLGKRPTLADIRRVAPVPIVRKFERYMTMREKIRGLAGDVYGQVTPNNLPSAPSESGRRSPDDHVPEAFHLTNYKNVDTIPATSSSTDVVNRDVGVVWDEYDRPSSWEYHPTIRADVLRVGADGNKVGKRDNRLSPNDYRKIGRYRLMETMDINRFAELRKKLRKWSDSFKKKKGRRPLLSDVESNGRGSLYTQFCEYIDMRNRMSGLMQEVLGTEVDNVEILKKMNAEGKEALESLKIFSAGDDVSDHTVKEDNS